MAVNPLFIPLFNIEEVILDKDTGLPLAAGVVNFYRDSQRVTPKEVFQISGSSPNYTFTSVGASLTLGLSGTFVDSDGDPFVPYAYPYDAEGELDLYYVTVESSGAVAQFTREAVPYVNTAGVAPADRTSTENELSNPQFVEVNFPTDGTTTVSVTGSNTVTAVAPGWDIISSGTGTIELTRLQPTSAGVVTNPSYTLQITASSGLGSTVQLRQRLNNSPSLFRGGFVSGSLIAAVISGGTSFITMTYAPSTGTSTEIIPSTSIPVGGTYSKIANNAEIPDQANTAADDGYVDIILTLPTSRTLALSSIQAVGTATSIDIPYDEQSADRQKDHLFHYYESELIYKPKKSLLTGWNFPLNPYQFITTTITTLVAQTAYVADQTIVHQEAASQIQTGKNVVAQRGNFVVKAVTAAATTRFALIQYIDPKTIAPYWSYILSSLVRARIVTTHGTQVPLKARLIYRSSLPSTIGAAEPISGWTAGSDPTFAAGWTAITPLNDPEYILPNTYADGTSTSPFTYPAFQFNGFQLPESDNANMTLGIVIYTMDNLNSTLGTEDYIEFDQISLIPGEFASDALPQTFNESLADCQFYYRKSYPQGVLPGAFPNFSGASTAISTTSYAAGVSFYTERYPAMRATPSTAATYSPQTGTIAKLFEVTAAADKDTATVNRGDSGFMVQTATGITNADDTLQWHYVADARLGV